MRNPGLLVEVDRVFALILNRIVKLETQIRFLTNTRNALLPKLMSGELRIQNVDDIS